MEVRNTWMLMYAVAGATLLGACAHQPVVKEETSRAAATPPKVSVAPTVKPEASAASDRTNTDLQDLVSLMQESIIHFAFDDAQLTPESQTRLQKLADALRTHRNLRIRISGHCDERGTEEYNLALGQKRAETAKSYLATLGIDPERIETISFGEERPADPQQTEEAWAANRRDEFTAAAAP